MSTMFAMITPVFRGGLVGLRIQVGSELKAIWQEKVMHYSILICVYLRTFTSKKL